MPNWLTNLLDRSKNKKLAKRHEQNLLKADTHYGKFGRFVRVLGPGVVTGAADD